MQAFWGTVMLLIALWTTAVQAQSQQVNIFTFEDASCSAWQKSSANKVLRAQYEFWIRGFVSGHNYANSSRQVEVGTLPGSDGLYRYLDQYCRDNPNSSFVGGAITLVDQLRKPAAPLKPAPKKPAKAAQPATK